MKKYGFIIIILIIVVGGAFWLSSKKEASPIELEETDELEETEDEVVRLLENLKQETNIDFPAMQDVEFDWMVEKYQEITKVAIQGKGFEAERISDEEYRSVESFLKNKGFEVDVYNVAAGTISELTGYKKEYLVCVVIGGASGYKEATGQWIPPESDKKDVEVKCGKGDSSIDPIISKEEAIKRLFAQKYQTKASSINIDINQETANHLKGTIEVLDEFAQGGAGDKGMFLAVQVNGHWQIVEEKEQYYFPEEISIEIENGDNFSVILEANPTTGYQWEIDFEADYLQLVDREYTAASSELIGGGGDETFNFLALKSGQTEITFSYLRPWEEDKPAIEEKIYQIIIK